MLLENFYTTKMSLQKKKLQHRFSKIRSENGKKSKTAALIISLILTACVLCATVAVAVINKNNVVTNYTFADFSGDIKKIKQLKTDISFKTIPGRMLITDTGIAVYEIDSEKLTDEGI